jgi:hypothetical protein
MSNQNKETQKTKNKTTKTIHTFKKSMAKHHKRFTIKHNRTDPALVQRLPLTHDKIPQKQPNVFKSNNERKTR